MVLLLGMGCGSRGLPLSPGLGSTGAHQNQSRARWWEGGHENRRNSLSQMGNGHLFSLVSRQYAHGHKGRLAAGCGEQGQTPTSQRVQGVLCMGSRRSAWLSAEPVLIVLQSCFQRFLISWPIALLMNARYWHGCRMNAESVGKCVLTYRQLEISRGSQKHPSLRKHS